jgi:hypothetical protein
MGERRPRDGDYAMGQETTEEMESTPGEGSHRGGDFSRKDRSDLFKKKAAVRERAHRG